jgi:D-alanyl-D-alanine carboxypeptidase/D-alanyl-D-alanine-endopeptidase (penicillin-binding protein 4)
VAAGLEVVRGRVIAALGPFVRDTTAPGWKSWFDDVLVPPPTALTFRGNRTRFGAPAAVPEQRAAAALSRMLENRGVRVSGAPTAGRSRAGLVTLAGVARPLVGALTRMDQVSDNFAAEVLGKRLGLEAHGRGSIAGGAAAVCGFEAAVGVTATCRDSSGLSYANRQTARGMVRLLLHAQRQPWGPDLRTALPRGGAGSLQGRLTDVHVRAKTGTLTRVSALSGWVRAESDGGWLAFSIMTRGIDSGRAKLLEDRVVHLLAARAQPPPAG